MPTVLSGPRAEIAWEPREAESDDLHQGFRDFAKKLGAYGGSWTFTEEDKAMADAATPTTPAVANPPPSGQPAPVHADAPAAPVPHPTAAPSDPPKVTKRYQIVALQIGKYAKGKVLPDYAFLFYGGAEKLAANGSIIETNDPIDTDVFLPKQDETGDKLSDRLALELNQANAATKTATDMAVIHKGRAEGLEAEKKALERELVSKVAENGRLSDQLAEAKSELGKVTRERDELKKAANQPPAPKK